MKPPHPPQTLSELLKRANALSGQSFAELAALKGVSLPSTLHRSKGFIGELLEWFLGADAHNKSCPDFTHLGVELKTLPLNKAGKPKETTYVCTAPIGLDSGYETWETSRVRNKLAKVLWVPIEACPSIPLPKRKIGSPFLFILNSETEAILKKDWEELMSMLHHGQVAHLSARFGTHLQVRPKAASSNILTETMDELCNTIKVVPKGFYLRSSFTQWLLDNHFPNEF
ncbi:MAG: mismatch repair endonuclease mutH [Francisellaceae bacterium]|nr:mismatch repair endonuclease mutH [Francisellaceae bacterium]